MKTIKLLGRPVSTNSIYRRHGNIMYMSKEGKEFKKSYILQIQNQYKFPLREDEIEIEVRLYFPNKLRRDIDNWNKILLDSCTGIVWKDDCQIQKMTITKEIDKQNPRIEIDIK